MLQRSLEPRAPRHGNAPSRDDALVVQEPPAAVLAEAIADLVAARQLDDEERPAFAFAEFVDRSGMSVDAARPLFEAALEEAKRSATHGQGATARSGVETGSAASDHDAPAPPAAPAEPPSAPSATTAAPVAGSRSVPSSTPATSTSPRSSPWSARPSPPESLRTSAEDLIRGLTSQAPAPPRTFSAPTKPCHLCRGTTFFCRDAPGSPGWTCARCAPPALTPERFQWHRDIEPIDAKRIEYVEHGNGRFAIVVRSVAERRESARTGTPGEATR